MVRLRRIEERDRIFFITTNLARGVTFLSPAERDLVLDTLGQQRHANRFYLFAYCVMPDHVHLLLASKSISLVRIMRDFKSRCGFEIAKRRKISGAVWQARYFDNIIRRTGQFWEKLEYIHQNPVAAGLVAKPDQWKWSSFSHYSQAGSVPVIPDPIGIPTDRNALLWPAPWKR